MNHPPIPPRSEFFIDECFCYRDEECPLAIIDVELGKHCDNTARIIAAVAEVEWRRRAERWRLYANKMWARIQTRIYDFGALETELYWLGMDRRKYDLAKAQELQCDTNAAEWRAWGEGK